MAKRTLEVATQMVELDDNLILYIIVKDHYKKKYPGLGYKRVQDYADCDLFQPADCTVASKQWYKYYLLITLNRTKTVNGHELKTKDKTPEALEDFFRDVCVPRRLLPMVWMN